MLVIKKLQIKNKVGNTKVIASICEVEKYTDVRKAETVEIEYTLPLLFIAVCQSNDNKVIFAKTCNNGFWYVNVKEVEKQALQNNINLSDMEKYYQINTGLFFEIFGELYNGFFERWRTFTSNHRQVIKSYI